MKRHLQCAEQHDSSCNFTKYCACHAKWISWLIRVSHETSFTMRGATGVTIQLHQILRLPRKLNLMINPPRIWNVIYNARSNKRHTTSSTNTAPATQNESHDWSASHMKRHLHCAEQAKSPSNLTKYCACHEICKFKISAESPWIASANRKTIRRHSDDNPTLKSSSRTRRFGDLTSHLGDAFCMEKYNISRSAYLSKFHEVLRLPRKVTFQLQQILRLPRKITLMIDPPHIIDVKYCACHEKCTLLFSTLFSWHLLSLGI